MRWVLAAVLLGPLFAGCANDEPEARACKGGVVPVDVPEGKLTITPSVVTPGTHFTVKFPEKASRTSTLTLAVRTGGKPCERHFVSMLGSQPSWVELRKDQSVASAGFDSDTDTVKGIAPPPAPSGTYLVCAAEQERVCGRLVIKD